MSQAFTVDIREAGSPVMWLFYDSGGCEKWLDSGGRERKKQFSSTAAVARTVAVAKNGDSI